jgi:endogenous inhibitor of DNA gyrase (YacG/DUF329 family)
MLPSCETPVILENKLEHLPFCFDRESCSGKESGVCLEGK